MTFAVRRPSPPLDRYVIGIDPAGAMLAVARQGAGAERVEWIEGDSSALEAWGADLAVMTGNVAQVFADDEAWLTTSSPPPASPSSMCMAIGKAARSPTPAR